MSPNIGWQDLKDLFRAAGNVVRADINMDHTTGQSKGTGVVVMDSKAEANAAIGESLTGAHDVRPPNMQTDMFDSLSRPFLQPCSMATNLMVAGSRSGKIASTTSTRPAALTGDYEFEVAVSAGSVLEAATLHTVTIQDIRAAQTCRTMATAPPTMLAPEVATAPAACSVEDEVVSEEEGQQLQPSTEHRKSSLPLHPFKSSSRM